MPRLLLTHFYPPCGQADIRSQAAQHFEALAEALVVAIEMRRRVRVADVDGAGAVLPARRVADALEACAARLLKAGPGSIVAF